MNNEFGFLKGEAVQEEQTQIFKPVMDAYDMMSDDSDIPFMPGLGSKYSPVAQNNNKAPAFLDLNNLNAVVPQKQMQQTQQAQNSSTQYQQTLAQFESQKKPNFKVNAGDNFNRMMGVLDGVADVVGSTSKDGSELNKHAIKVVHLSIKDCIEHLSDIPSWMPKGYEAEIPKLTQVANAIVKVLTQFDESIKKY